MTDLDRAKLALAGAKADRGRAWAAWDTVALAAANDAVYAAEKRLREIRDNDEK